MEVRAAALLFGFFLDFLFGDPRWLCHPVRLIGSAISAAEKEYGLFFLRHHEENGREEFF